MTEKAPSKLDQIAAMRAAQFERRPPAPKVKPALPNIPVKKSKPAKKSKKPRG